MASLTLERPSLGTERKVVDVASSMFYPSSNSSTAIMFNAIEYDSAILFVKDSIRIFETASNHRATTYGKNRSRYLGSFPEGEIYTMPSEMFVKLLSLSRKDSDDKSTQMFEKIISSTIKLPNSDYTISLQIGISSLHLATELITICRNIECYASPSDTFTFELYYDNKRATIVHGRDNSLVISRDNDMEWESYSNSPKDIDRLKEKVIQF